MDITITLPATLDVTSREQTATFNLENVNADNAAAFFAHAALHGLKQCIADSAASATALAKAEGETRTPAEIALDLMIKKCTALESGEWTQRREGAPSDPIGKEAYAMTLVVIKASPALLEKYKACDADGKVAMRKELLAKHEEKFRAKAKAELERRKAIASEFDLDL